MIDWMTVMCVFGTILFVFVGVFSNDWKIMRIEIRLCAKNYSVPKNEQFSFSLRNLTTALAGLY